MLSIPKTFARIVTAYFPLIALSIVGCCAGPADPEPGYSKLPLPPKHTPRPQTLDENPSCTTCPLISENGPTWESTTESLLWLDDARIKPDPEYSVHFVAQDKPETTYTLSFSETSYTLRIRSVGEEIELQLIPK